MSTPTSPFLERAETLERLGRCLVRELSKAECDELARLLRDADERLRVNARELASLRRELVSARSTLEALGGASA